MPQLHLTEFCLADFQTALLNKTLSLDTFFEMAKKIDDLGVWAVDAGSPQFFNYYVGVQKQNPWEYFLRLKAAMPNTLLQVSFDAQRLYGDEILADDVIDAFITQCVNSGVEVFRLSDANNDARNLKSAISSVKQQGKLAQAGFYYSANPSYNVIEFLEQAFSYFRSGADAFCILDEFGQLTPYMAYDLIQNLKQKFSLPLYFHSAHLSDASASVALKAVEAGALSIDTSLLFQYQGQTLPSTSGLVATFENTNRQNDVSAQVVLNISQQLLPLNVLNASSQLADADIYVQEQVPYQVQLWAKQYLDVENQSQHFEALIKTLPQVRQDLGCIPWNYQNLPVLFEQAFLNITSDADYLDVSAAVKRIVKGETGRTPKELSSDLQSSVLLDRKAIKCRPADLMNAQLPAFKKQIGTDDQCELLQNVCFTSSQNIKAFFYFNVNSIKQGSQAHTSIVYDTTLSDDEFSYSFNETQSLDAATDIDGSALSDNISAISDNNQPHSQEEFLGSLPAEVDIKPEVESDIDVQWEERDDESELAPTDQIETSESEEFKDSPFNQLDSVLGKHDDVDSYENEVHVEETFPEPLLNDDQLEENQAEEVAIDLQAFDKADEEKQSVDKPSSLLASDEADALNEDTAESFMQAAIPSHENESMHESLLEDAPSVSSLLQDSLESELESGLQAAPNDGFDETELLQPDINLDVNVDIDPDIQSDFKIDNELEAESRLSDNDLEHQEEIEEDAQSQAPAEESQSIPSSVDQKVVNDEPVDEKGSVIEVQELPQTEGKIPSGLYYIELDGVMYDVEVDEAGEIKVFEKDTLSDAEEERGAFDEIAQEADIAAAQQDSAGLSFLEGEAFYSPVEGMVSDVFFAEGEKFEQGDVLLTLDAQDKQIEVKAQFAGEIEKLVVEKQVKVLQGAPLVYVTQL